MRMNVTSKKKEAKYCDGHVLIAFKNLFTEN